MRLLLLSLTICQGNITAELARFVMGKEACALHEKGKRWFTHDGDEGDSSNHPLSFAVLDPLSVHPLASIRSLHIAAADCMRRR